MFHLQMQILVVDDMFTMRKLVAKCLRETGYQAILQADNGRAAWEKLIEMKNAGTPVGLVISDWNMPELSGLDLAKKLRSTADFKNLPFLMLTAESEPSQRRTALAAGVDAYLTKPFTKEMLLAELHGLSQKAPKAA